MTVLEGKLRPENIQNAHNQIKDGFKYYFSSRGYSIIPPGPLLPKNDRSVIFTGATITSLRHFLDEGIPTPGVAMVQNCLRTKRLEQMYDLEKIPEWTHYFTMLGILAAPDQKVEVVENAMDYIVNQLHIPKHKIKVLATAEDKDLIDPWKKAGFEIAEDTQPMENFRWKYGDENVVGRGISFEIQNEGGLPPRELGNIISVESPDGEIKGYEFGFGLESYLASFYNVKKPMEVSMVSAVVPFEEGVQEKILDALTATVVIAHNGIKPSGGGKACVVQQRLIKGLAHVLRKTEMPHDQIKMWANKFEEIEFGGQGVIGDNILEWVTNYNTKLEHFIEHVQNQVYAKTLRGEDLSNLAQKQIIYGASIGIANEDMEELLPMIIK